MSIKKLIEERDHITTAIESIEVLVTDHDKDVLQPTLTYLKEQRRAVATKVSNLKLNIEVQCETVNQLSQI